MCCLDLGFFYCTGLASGRAEENAALVLHNQVCLCNVIPSPFSQAINAIDNFLSEELNEREESLLKRLFWKVRHFIKMLYTSEPVVQYKGCH